MENNNYCVYLHTVPKEISGYDFDKYYVGMTGNLNKRWSYDGKNYKQCPIFYKAIKKYGWDNIKHEVLESNLSKIEAQDLEIYYIEKYKSLNFQNGYNVCLGGYLERPGRQIAFYNENGDLWNVFKDAKEVSLKYNIDVSAVRERIKLGRLIDGYKAMFIENHIIPQKIETPISKIVEQYDLYGKFIREWCDAYEASEYYSRLRGGKVIANMVNKVCLGYRTLAYGFQWKYKDDNKEIKDVSNEFVLCSNGQYITKHARYMQNHKKTVRKTPIVNIYKYDLYGNYISNYNSYKDAYNEYDKPDFAYGTFSHVLRNRFSKNSFKEYKGFIWTNIFYDFIPENDLHQHGHRTRHISKRNKKSKSCIKINKNTHAIEDIFETVSEAYMKTGTKPSQIYKCCKGYSKSANGFLWRYIEDIEESQICDSFLLEKYRLYKNRKDI